MLPCARCALTAPFHPYSPPRLFRAATAQQARGPAAPKPRSGEGGRYVFCATVLRVAPTGRYPAHCPAEFGLSSHLRTPRIESRATAGKPIGLGKPMAGLPAVARESILGVRRRAVVWPAAIPAIVPRAGAPKRGARRWISRR